MPLYHLLFRILSNFSSSTWITVYIVKIPLGDLIRYVIKKEEISKSLDINLQINKCLSSTFGIISSESLPRYVYFHNLEQIIV